MIDIFNVYTQRAYFKIICDDFFKVLLCLHYSDRTMYVLQIYWIRNSGTYFSTLSKTLLFRCLRVHGVSKSILNEDKNGKFQRKFLNMKSVWKLFLEF